MLPPMRDAVIMVLSSLSRSELLTEEGKLHAKKKLVEEINKELGKEVAEKVYFTYFAVQ